MAQGLPPGLGEALTMMKSGSKWTVFLPYQLAFNDQPALGSPMQAPKVGPYSALIFDVELESSRPKPPPPVRSAPPAVTPQVGVQNPGTPSVSLSPTRPGPQTSSDIVRVPFRRRIEEGEQRRSHVAGGSHEAEPDQSPGIADQRPRRQVSGGVSRLCPVNRGRAHQLFGIGGMGAQPNQIGVVRRHREKFMFYGLNP